MHPLSDHPDRFAHPFARKRALACPPLLAFIVPLILLLCASVSSTRGASVVIVKASEAEPYAQADESIHRLLAAHKDEMRTVILKELVDRDIAKTIGHPDMVIAVGTPSARWLQKQLPPAIKLVYCMVTNAEDAGLLAGRESWGVTTEVAIAEQIGVIAEALPRARTMGMLCRSDTPDGKRAVESVRKALPEGWRLEAVPANDYPSIATAIDALTQKNIDLIWTSTDQKIYDTAAVRALLLAGLRTKTPVWGFSPAFVRAGAMIGVAVEPRAQGNQAAALAIKLLDGPARPAGKVELPAEFQIAVNLIVAKQIGVDIPEALVRKAAFVYRPEN